MSNLNIIIYAAGPCRKMKKCGPKLLLKVKNKVKLLSYYLRAISNIGKKYNIIVVGGYMFDYLKENLPKEVKLVKNFDFFGSPTKSIAIGIKQNPGPCLIISGDIIFGPNALKLEYGKSNIVFGVNSKNKTFSDIPELLINEDKIINITYGIRSKYRFGKIFYLNKVAAKHFVDISSNEKNNNLLPFEIINKLIDLGHEFQFNKASKIISVNTKKELK